MAIPAYLRAGTAVQSSTNAAAPAFPTTVNAGELALLVAETANQVVDTPAGWTLAPSSPAGAGTAGGTDATRLTIFWKRCDGSEASTTVSLNSPGDHVLARILLFGDVVATGDPFNAHSNRTSATVATGVTYPGLTTTATDCLVLHCASRSNDSGSTLSFTRPDNPDFDGNATFEQESGGTAGNGGGFVVSGGERAVPGVIDDHFAETTVASMNGAISLALMSTTSVVEGGGAVTATGTGSFAAVVAGAVATSLVAGAGGGSFAPVTSVATATAQAQGAGGGSFAPVTSAAVGSFDIVATGTASFAPVTASGYSGPAGAITATASVSFAPVTSAATAAAQAQGAGGGSFAPVTSAAAAEMLARGAGGGSFAPVTSEAAATSRILASGTASFAPVTSAAFGGDPYERLPVPAERSASPGVATLAARTAGPAVSLFADRAA